MSRRVLVTGGSRGIGRAVSLRLGADGFDLTVAYRSREQEARAVVAEIESAGGRAAALQLDVADRESTRQALEGLVKEHGPYWGVVSNAGVTEDGPFPSLSGEAWDRVLRTNLDGFYNVVQPLVMPMVRGRQGGRIVAMSSVAGLMGNRGQVNYSASKAGLIGASKALAQELAKRRITVNVVAPGLIETEMLEGVPVDAVLPMIPMRRLGRPEEVAAAVGYLFSEGAGYVTAQVLSVNGGMV
ncbi:MAG: 3-oxoacyl-ACP reductase FabG [Myxococcota bacterium]